MKKKLKGHKPHCKCVGCSADTRRRGMKALGLSKKAPRSHSKRRRMVRAAVKKLAAMKKYPNPKRRKKIKARRKPAALQRRNLAKRRHANPVGHSIGTAVLVFSSRGNVRGARLMTGPGEHRFTVLGTGSRRIDGAKVRRVEYRNDAKAMRAYGRRAPFQHTFSSPAHVLSSGGGRIVIESSRRLWEKQ